MPAANRVALVIGNGAYGQGKLENAVRDAALITARLRALRFEIVGGAATDDHPTGLSAGVDPCWNDTLALLRQFLEGIRPGGTAVIYYAGHALQVGDQNMLMPVDCTLADDQPDLGLIKIKSFIEKAAEKAGRNGCVVTFLDACRNCPLDDRQQRMLLNLQQRQSESEEHGQQSGTALARGLGTFKMSRDLDRARTFIGLATAPGDVAYDGKGGSLNSPFAQALDRHLQVRGLDIEQLYDRVAKDVTEQVAQELGRYQDPWSETNLNRPLYLHPPTTAPFFWLGLAGLVVGAIISRAVFHDGEVIKVVAQPIWGCGILFGFVAAAGVLIWGSKRASDAAFAFFGPVIGFALALAVLQITPSFETVEQTAEPMPSKAVAESVYFGVTLTGGALFYLGTFLVWHRNQTERPQSWLQWVNRIVTLALPALVVLLLLLLQPYISDASPLLTVITMFAVLSGIIYAGSTALALRAQRGLFARFGPFTGAITVGLLMPAFFIVYLWLAEGKAAQDSNWLLIALGAAWHGLLGAQLGYCFAAYIPDHAKWQPPD